MCARGWAFFSPGLEVVDSRLLEERAAFHIYGSIWISIDLLGGLLSNIICNEWRQDILNPYEILAIQLVAPLCPKLLPLPPRISTGEPAAPAKERCAWGIICGSAE